MAIAIDVANLGSTATDASSSTIAFTTGSAVASGGFIVVSVGWFDTAATLSSVSGGGLTWTIDKQGKAGTTQDNIALVSAQAPSGLASGTTITATYSAAVFARHIAGTSFTGVATSSPVDTTVGPTSASATTAWATASATIQAGSVLIGSCYNESANGTQTATSPSIEAVTWGDSVGPTSHTTCYRIESSAGSYTVAGTWNSAVTSGNIGVAYLAAAGGAPVPVFDLTPWVAHVELGPGDYGPNPFLEVLPPITTTGPQTFLQSLTATTVTTTASIVKQVGKFLTATTVATTATIVKQVNKALTATTVAITASMTALKVILLTLTATTVTTTASIVKQVNKFLTATTLALTASIVKQVNKLLTATTVALTASLNAIKVILRTLTATTVSLTATMVRQVGKPLTATTVALTASIVKRVNKALTATTVALTATMTAIKVILRTLTATTVTTTATMTRRVGTAVTATATVTASIAKRVGKTISGAISNVASLVAQFFGPPTQDLYPTPFEYTEQHNDLTYQEQTGLTYREPRKFTGN